MRSAPKKPFKFLKTLSNFLNISLDIPGGLLGASGGPWRSFRGFCRTLKAFYMPLEAPEGLLKALGGPWRPLEALGGPWRPLGSK